MVDRLTDKRSQFPRFLKVTVARLLREEGVVRVEMELGESSHREGELYLYLKNHKF